MYLGTAYYPEHWPRERWATDLDMMKNAGISRIRLGEFAWTCMQPSADEFDFSWLVRVLDLAEERGICAILGTPTAAPPKWLMDEHPEIYPVDPKGIRTGFGHRVYRCINNPAFLAAVDTLVHAMAARFANDSRIESWQIDNELGIINSGRCFCEHCRLSFQSWLREKYGTIEQLNSAWGTVFSNQTYPCFESLILPAYHTFGGHNPGLALDHRRFVSDRHIEFYRRQADIIHSYSADSRVTTNMMWNGPDIDYYKLVPQMEFKSVDLYPNCTDDRKVTAEKPAYGYDMIRGFDQGGEFEVFEHQAGTPGGGILFPSPRPGDFRRWSWQSIARGAVGLVYFRWRTCAYGLEDYWHGILGHTGQPNRRYRELQNFASELQPVASLFDGGSLPSRVAIMRDYDCQWIYENQPHTPGYEYDHHVRSYHHALYHSNVPVNLVGYEADLSSYDLVILPNAITASEKLTQRIENYVQGGGEVLLDFRAGAKNRNNSMNTNGAPGAWKTLLGLEVEEYGIIPEGEEQWVSLAGERIRVAQWFEELTLHGAEAEALYGEDYYAGFPAITSHQYGTGRSWYLASEPDSEGMKTFLGILCSRLGIESTLGVNLHGLEVIPRLEAASNQVENPFYVLINHNPHSVRLSAQLELDALDVVLIRGSLDEPEYLL